MDARTMWERIATERLISPFEIDKSFSKTNEDGTVEKIRFVKYPDTPNGTVEKFHSKMKESKLTFGEIFGTDETEHTWDFVFSTVDRVTTKEFTIFGNHSHRVELVLKTLIDICYDKSIHRKSIHDR